MAGREGAQLAKGCSVPERGFKGKICLSVPAVLLAQMLVFGGEGGWDGGLQPCLPRSASEVARADSGCWFLLGHHRALFVFCIQLHFGLG